MNCPRINKSWLAHHPLPTEDPDGDKETKGHVLVIAGSREMPGAALLSAVAALRSGAGKLTVASPHSVAPAIAIALPEARVVSTSGSRSGLRPSGGAMKLGDGTPEMSAVLIGPGMAQGRATVALARAVIDAFARTPMVLDAVAMNALLRLRKRRGPILITPHAGELAHLTGWTKESISADRVGCATRAAKILKALVLLKGATSVLAGPEGALWCHVNREAGLGTSGSGDVLAGIIVGLAAQGAELSVAAAWGTVLHARCGARLARTIGKTGYLARELADEVARARAAGPH
jgi:ADP-dependent NAD(P)H-hydrate dehydratase